MDDGRNNKNLDGTGDDVFVSLDAFDMLTDFQELDILEHTAAQQAPSEYDFHQLYIIVLTIRIILLYCTIIMIVVFSADMATEIESNSTEIQQHMQAQLDMNVLQITDYCPEWAFPEVCENRR